MHPQKLDTFGGAYFLWQRKVKFKKSTRQNLKSVL